MSYTFIKEVNYSDYKPQPILAISQEIETLKITDTYNGWGQQVSPVDAGAYLTLNTQKAVDIANKTYHEEYSEADDLEVLKRFEIDDFVSAYDHNSVYDSVQNECIENEDYTIEVEKCEGFNYWDGNNWKTVTVSTEQYEPSHEKVEIEGLNDEIDSACHVESKGAFHLYESENYWMVESQYTTAFEKYSIYLKSEVDRDDIF